MPILFISVDNSTNRMTTDTLTLLNDISNQVAVNSAPLLDDCIEDESFIEPLLDPKNARDSLYPILYPKLWDAYNIHVSLHWVASEVDLTQDLRDWNTVLTDDERYYMSMVLAYFAGSDLIVNEKEAKGVKQVTCLEYKFFVDDKIARENIHTIAYANMLDTYISDPVQRKHLREAVKTIPTIKRKADWFRKYIDEGDFVCMEVATAIVEGVFFSGGFASIYWMRKRGLMKALCELNDFIAREEGLHRDFSALVFREEIVHKLPTQTIYDMVDEAVTIECEFTVDALPVKLIGMNSDAMCQYIRYVADKVLLELGLKKLYNVSNPFSFMVYISLQTNTDFFAHRPNAYSKQTQLTKKEDNVVRFTDMDY